MNAAVYYGPMDLRIESVDQPECPQGGCIIKVGAVGICGSDVRTYYSGSHKIRPPMILGHEAVGEVVEISPDHDVYRVGDRLAMAPGIYCNKCYYCERGMTTMCENLVELAFQYPGGFAEYMPIPGIAFQRGRIVPVPNGLSDEHASLCEVSSSCVMAQEKADVCLGETVVILGVGPIGCIHIQVARARGASKIIIVDVAANRLAQAEPFGADFQINAAQEDPVKKVMEITSARGADTIMVCSPSAVAEQQAVEMSRKRGTVVFFAGLPKDEPFARLNSNLIHYRDIRIIGHYGQERRHVLQSLEMISRKQISAEHLITHRFPLAEICKGVELVKAGKALKVTLNP
jgi:L-iditol 2-dehydrogenase